MKQKLTYNGLSTRRITVEVEASLLTASVRQNKPKAGNNGWQHDDQDEITIENNQFDLSLH